jgi:glycosyl transferase/beta-hydroxylase protein BlmF
VLYQWEGELDETAPVPPITRKRNPNVPVAISMLLPSRGRPASFLRLYESALATADDPDAIEFCVYLDHDEPAVYPFEDDNEAGIKVVRGGRVVLSEMWNRCFEVASGDILMHCGDDLVFRSHGWDTAVREAYDEVDDRLLFVHGRDGNHEDGSFGTHGFLHRRWVETVGYFVPPYFSSDFNDTWLNDVANAIERRVYLHAVFTDHMHFAYGKGPLDTTHQERLERHERDGVESLYESEEMQQRRERDARLLLEVINTHHHEEVTP